MKSGAARASKSPGLALLVAGGHRLNGHVRTSGFKHSMVTLLSAAAMGRSTVRLGNCPDLQETRALVDLLSRGGALVERQNESIAVTGAGFGSSVDSRDLFGSSLAASIHGSVYLLPAILLRRKSARLPFDGGCRIGSNPQGRRPAQQYVEVLRRFGARTRIVSNEIVVTANELRGCEIDLLDFTSDHELRTGPLYSGASKMALLCAAAAKGDSVLRHLYPKPDVADLVDMLSAMGADIERGPGETVTVRGQGGQDLTRDALHVLMPDLIEIVTWIVAGALLAEDSIEIFGTAIERSLTALAPELAVLQRMGVRFLFEGGRLIVYPQAQLSAIEVTVASCGVYSDAQPLISLLSCWAHGKSTIRETVWRSRFRYITGLRALGARVSRRGNVLKIDGPAPPHRPGRHIVAPDLRAASTLLLAALTVQGQTILHGAEQLDRGYDGFVHRLQTLGARITPTDNS